MPNLGPVVPAAALAALNESLEELRAAQSVENWLAPGSGGA